MSEAFLVDVSICSASLIYCDIWAWFKAWLPQGLHFTLFKEYRLEQPFYRDLFCMRQDMKHCYLS